MDESRRLLDRLKQFVDDEHRSATQALEILGQYLNSGSKSPDVASASILLPLIQRLIDRESRHSAEQSTVEKQRIRDRVLSCVSSRPKTIRDIATETDLTERQVRGVLYATDVEKKVQRLTGPKPVQFRMRETSIQSFSAVTMTEKGGSPAATGEPRRQSASLASHHERRPSDDLQI